MVLVGKARSVGDADAETRQQKCRPRKAAATRGAAERGTTPATLRNGGVRERPEQPHEKEQRERPTPSGKVVPPTRRAPTSSPDASARLDADLRGTSAACRRSPSGARCRSGRDIPRADRSPAGSPRPPSTSPTATSSSEVWAAGDIIEATSFRRSSGMSADQKRAVARPAAGDRRLTRLFVGQRGLAGVARAHRWLPPSAPARPPLFERARAPAPTRARKLQRKTSRIERAAWRPAL